MIVQLPHPPLCFEIPDEWWRQGGMVGFHPSSPCYRHKDPVGSQVVECLVKQVAPIIRHPSLQRTFRGFDQERFLRILSGFLCGNAMPPVDVVKNDPISEEGCCYRLRDGYHRFYGSIAAGFTHLPVHVLPDWRKLPSSPFSVDPDISP